MTHVNMDPILIVDDEPGVRSMLSQVLRDNHYAVDTAINSAEALEKIQNDSFSLVIADVRMPEISGIELLEKLKANNPAVPVIMITGFGSVNDAVEAMQKGAADYLLKPFSNKLLLKSVKNYLLVPETGQALANKPTTGITDANLPNIITQDATMQRLLSTAQTVASSKATVLIEGESGTGKELLARYIHQNSDCGGAPYLAVNCAALPESLAESELFGHEKGAFTGAVLQKPGKFELAQNGTIVLDEISEMALPLQAKILRVLQERLIDRVGGRQPVSMNARVIAISNVDLKATVKQGKFRKDLYYRVNVIPITIPPLRKRKQDLPLLVEFFMQKWIAVNGLDPVKMSSAAMKQLIHYDWPGNIRELENTIERAVLIHSGDRIQPCDLILDQEPMEFDQVADAHVPVKAGTTVKEMEKQLIFKTLETVNDNRTHAAEMLGISIRTLRNKLHEYRQNRQTAKAAAGNRPLA